MTPQRKQYLAKCIGREKRLRHLINCFEAEIKRDKAVCSSYNLKASDRKHFGYILHIKNINDNTVVLKALYHELARLKGMDKAAKPKEITKHPQFNIGYAVCKCGANLILHQKYCSKCGSRMLWGGLTCGNCIYCVKSEGKPYYCAIKALYHFVDANKKACEEFRGLDELEKPMEKWK